MYYPYFESVALVEADRIRLWLNQDSPGMEGKRCIGLGKRRE